jgi:hypothetical protein
MVGHDEIDHERNVMICIEEHNNGPIGRGHGGTSAGRFAALVNPTAATVRFHNPVPLGTPMSWVANARGTDVLNGSEHIATVRPLAAPLKIGQFGRLPAQLVLDAEERWLDARGGQHMAPTCIACGHQRSDTAALGLRPGPVEDTSLFATNWSPGIDGLLPADLVWTALDCPTGFPAVASLEASYAAVTGELSVQTPADIPGDGNYQLISRRTGVDGRKVYTEAALVDEKGRSLAVATATWIVVLTELLFPQLPANELIAA